MRSAALGNPFQPDQLIFGHEPELLVDGSAAGRGVEPRGLHAAPVEIFQGVFRQSRADAPAADPLVDQQHGDPADRAKNAVGDRAHGLAVQLGHEAAVGLEVQEASPVGLGLVEAGLLSQAHPQRHVGSGHGSDLKHFNRSLRPSQPAWARTRTR